MPTSDKRSDRRLENLEHEVDRLGAMAAEALAKAKSTGFRALDSFISRGGEARERMGEMGSASGDAWHELRQGLETAWTNMHGAMQNAITKFQQQQATETPSPDGHTTRSPGSSARLSKSRSAKGKNRPAPSKKSKRSAKNASVRSAKAARRRGAKRSS